MSQLSIQDVNSAIMFGDFTNDQLSSIASAIKFRRGQIVKETKRSLGSLRSLKCSSAAAATRHTVLLLLRGARSSLLSVCSSQKKAAECSCWRAAPLRTAQHSEARAL